MGYQPEFGVQAVVEFIFRPTVLYLSRTEVLVDFPTKSQVREIVKDLKFFILLKNQRRF